MKFNGQLVVLYTSDSNSLDTIRTSIYLHKINQHSIGIVEHVFLVKYHGSYNLRM